MLIFFSEVFARIYFPKILFWKMLQYIQEKNNTGALF